MVRASLLDAYPVLPSHSLSRGRDNRGGQERNFNQQRPHYTFDGPASWVCQSRSSVQRPPCQHCIPSGLIFSFPGLPRIQMMQPCGS